MIWVSVKTHLLFFPWSLVRLIIQTWTLLISDLLLASFPDSDHKVIIPQRLHKTLIRQRGEHFSVTLLDYTEEFYRDHSSVFKKAAETMFRWVSWMWSPMIRNQDKIWFLPIAAIVMPGFAAFLCFYMNFNLFLLVFVSLNRPKSHFEKNWFLARNNLQHYTNFYETSPSNIQFRTYNWTNCGMFFFILFNVRAAVVASFYPC